VWVQSMLDDNEEGTELKLWGANRGNLQGFNRVGTFDGYTSSLT
jgi:hypothetical protein